MRTEAKLRAVWLDVEDESLLQSLIKKLKLSYSDILRIGLRRMAEDELLNRKRK